MREAKEKHKQNLVQKQVVAGKEFKGTAFIAKPDVILFKVAGKVDNARTSKWARRTDRRCC